MQFADVVHETVELPLGCDLASASMTEPIESMRAAQVREHRLDDPQPLTVSMPPDFAIDLTLHPSAVGFRLTLGAADEQRHLAFYGSLRMAQALRPQRAVPTLAFVSAEADRLKALKIAVSAVAIETLPGWADRVAAIRSDREVLRPPRARARPGFRAHALPVWPGIHRA